MANKAKMDMPYDIDAKPSLVNRAVEESAGGLILAVGIDEAEACAAVMVQYLDQAGDEDRRRHWMLLLLELHRSREIGHLVVKRRFN